MTILDKIREHNPEAIIWDDLNDAIIGFTTNYVAVYDIHKLAKCLLKNNPEWEEQDALEYIDYNILDVHDGEFSPLHIYTK
jgi:hypothetical protein